MLFWSTILLNIIYKLCQYMRNVQIIWEDTMETEIASTCSVSCRLFWPRYYLSSFTLLSEQCIVMHPMANTNRLNLKLMKTVARLSFASLLLWIWSQWCVICLIYYWKVWCHLELNLATLHDANMGHRKFSVFHKILDKETWGPLNFSY